MPVRWTSGGSPFLLEPCKKYLWLPLLLSFLTAVPSYAQYPSAPYGPPPPSMSTPVGKNGEVDLSWSVVPSAVSYTIKRSTTLGSGSQSIATPAGTQTSYQDTGLTNGVTYYYTISTYDGTTQGTDSAPVTAIPKDIITIAPANLTAVGGMSPPAGSGPWTPSVTLYWTSASYNSGAPLYDSVSILRRIQGAPQFQQINFNPVVGGGDTRCVDTDAALQDGTTYEYEVCGVNGNGAGPKSNIVSATPGLVWQSPLNLMAVAYPGAVSLLWQGVPGASKYHIQRATVSNGTAGVYTEVGATTACNYLDADLSSSTAYSYQVVSEGSQPAFLSSPSSAASATPGTVSAPADLHANVKTSSVELRWPISPGATSYQIFRWKSSDPQPTQPYATISGPCGDWSDSPTPDSNNNYVLYSYCVAAVSGGVASSPSSVATAAPDPNQKLGCSAICSGDVNQNVNPYVNPYCTGTNCGVAGTAGVKQYSGYYIQSAQLSINGAVVSQWNNDSSDQTVTSRPLGALFDSTYFGDGAKLDICMKSTAAGIPMYGQAPPPVTTEYHTYSIVFNRALAYGDSAPGAPWRWGLGTVGTNVENDAVNAFSSMNYSVGQSSVSADKLTMLGSLPGGTAFLGCAHGNPGVFSSCLGTGASPELDYLYATSAGGPGGNADIALEPSIGQENYWRDDLYPGVKGYRFAFLVACSTTAHDATYPPDTQLSDAFGITFGDTALADNRLWDRAYLGFPDEIIIDSKMQDCASSILNSLGNGHTVQDAVANCTPADEFSSTAAPGSSPSPISPEILGDPNTSIYGLVYGSNTPWAGVAGGIWYTDTKP